MPWVHDHYAKLPYAVACCEKKFYGFHEAKQHEEGHRGASA